MQPSQEIQGMTTHGNQDSKPLQSFAHGKANNGDARGGVGVNGLPVCRVSSWQPRKSSESSIARPSNASFSQRA
jgi:hypothetical protein